MADWVITLDVLGAALIARQSLVSIAVRKHASKQANLNSIFKQQALKTFDLSSR